MKGGLLIVLLAALVGVGAFGGYYSWQKPMVHAAPMSELEWLRQEFKLDGAQFAKVQEIHATYQPICDYLCTRVIEAQTQLERKIVTSTDLSEDLKQALADFSRMKEECHRAMLRHVYEVAAVMTPEDRQRYIEKAKLQVIMHDRVH